MSREALAKLLLVYLGALVILCLSLALWLEVDRTAERPMASIVSVWQDGLRKARAVTTGDPGLLFAQQAQGGAATRVAEEILDEGPVLSENWLLFALSFVPARDAIEARYRDRVAYATPDDLIKIRAYSAGFWFGSVKVSFGVDAALAQAFLAQELSISVEELLAEGRFRRLAVRRRILGEPPAKLEVSKDTVRRAAILAGQYLARMVKPDGSYLYELDGATGEELPGYNWPRHSGATWFLSEVAGFSGDRRMQAAARLAADRLTQYALVDCGERRCIAEGDRADLGSSALALLGLTELIENGVYPELREYAQALGEFLLSQQRPDGEFKHLYDRVQRTPIDIQLLYYTGEAALALSRLHRVTRDVRYLHAAERALAILVEKPIWYIGWRYYWQAEHWTCHALSDLWDRAPNWKALRFCMDWQEFVRNTSVRDREAAPEYDGASTSGPFVPPQLVATSTRMEAAVSTLSAARRAGLPKEEVERLETGIQEAIGFLIRSQFAPGPAHLMPDPALMLGGVATSETDFRVRIDYPQHAGTALLGYLKLWSLGSERDAERSGKR